MGEGVPQAPLHSLYLSPFEPTDSTSMAAHLSDLVPNVSSPLQGWRTEKRDLRTEEQEERVREPMEGQRGEK